MEKPGEVCVKSKPNDDNYDDIHAFIHTTLVNFSIEFFLLNFSIEIFNSLQVNQTKLFIKKQYNFCQLFTK